jgi:hypothetical protein
MSGAAIAIDDASDTDTILSIKERVFAINRELPVRRQRLVYRPGPRGMDALADDETLGSAGVARDGSAELDVLIQPLTDDDIAALGERVSVACSSLHSYFCMSPLKIVFGAVFVRPSCVFGLMGIVARVFESRPFGRHSRAAGRRCQYRVQRFGAIIMHVGKTAMICLCQ